MSKLYCMYLRKSRADLEAEARGEGETLSRHRRTLTELAIRMHLPLGEVYDEIRRCNGCWPILRPACGLAFCAWM